MFRAHLLTGMSHALVIVTVALLFATESSSGERSSSAPPNVVFVLTDDQGYGDLSCHGNPVLKTPKLDELHGQSIRFTNFHVSPMCTPTRAELMSGQDALLSGADCACSGGTFLREGLPTMAEIFADSGYRTGIFGKWHLGDNHPHRPQDRGFQEAVYHLGWGITSTADYWDNDYYERWWSRVEPTLSTFGPLSIGAEEENPACLTSLDWLAPTLVIAAQPFDVRLLGKTKVVEGSLPLGRPQPTLNCPWLVDVRQAGAYEISLRRWPLEADTFIVSPLPEYKGVDGSYPAGLAFPASNALLKIADVDVSASVTKTDKAVTC